MYQQNNSPPRHMEASFNVQGPSSNLHLQGPEINRPPPQANFSLQPPQGNINIQGPEVNYNRGHETNLSFNGPSLNYGSNNNETSQIVPFGSEQIKAYIRRKPYTQRVEGEELTYSVLPKKQNTFVMTHERFLFLKGTDIIAYARQFPQRVVLPFRSFSEMPAPKTAKRVIEIQKVTFEQDNLIILFSGKQQLKWIFQCPTKRCAIKWAQKIQQTMMRAGNGRQTGNFGGLMDSRTRRQNVNQINTYLNTNTNNNIQSSSFNSNVTGQGNFNANVTGQGNFNANLQGPRIQTNTNNFNTTGQGNFNVNLQGPRIQTNTNRSVFQTRRADNIRIDDGPRFGTNVESNMHSTSFNVQTPNISVNTPNINTNYETNKTNIHTNYEVNNTNINTNYGSNNTNFEVNRHVNYQRDNNFAINANFNDGRGISPPKDIMFSQANSLGSRQNIQYQNKNYFQGNQMSKVEDFIASRRVERSGYEPQLFFSKSVSEMNVNERQNIRRQISKMRRNWIQELLGGQEQVQLIIDFKSYVQKIAAVIITQLYMNQQQKIFPATQMTKDFGSFVLDDVYIELYFFNQQIEDKHPRFKQASLEFKNLDYLLSVTRNEGTLKVPFMMLFEYKGFLGMARTRLPDSAPRNRQCVNHLNTKEFEDSTRISIDTLLNEQKCKIVSYYRRTPISTTSFNNGNVYFVERLMQLLPLERQTDNIPTHVLRPELILDKAFNGTVFRNRLRPVRMDGVNQIIDLKINQLIKFIQNEEEYFTNSRQLEEMLHLTGLNMRHLGIMYQRARLNWFKRIIQAEIIARALKNIFRKDIQSCIMIQSQRNKSRQKQQDYQRRRVISFLNVVFGNTQDTAQVWRRINRICQQRFGIAVSEGDIAGTNIPFLMQAIQTHLKIVLNDSIHRKRYFASPQTFDPEDFRRFDFDTNIYNLDFTNLFEEIEDCMDFQTAQSFYNLSSILIKQTSNRVPIIQMLKKHPIHERISQFLLNFTSPDESQELYSRMEVDAKPSRFLYQSKLAEIKWYLKMNRLQRLQRPASFIFENGRKWLGDIHPMFTQVSRIIASYFSDHLQHFNLALRYAQQSLQMQKKVFGGDNEALWKDYFLLGKIYFTNKNVEQAMKYLLRSRDMIRVQQINDFQTFSELNLLLCKGHFGARRYKDAYNTAKQLYTMLRNHKDEKSLSFLLESVGWMRQILQMTQQYHTYAQFLESDFSNYLKAFAQYPSLLVSAIRTVSIPTLKNAITLKSRNGIRIISLMEELSRMTQASQSTLSNYLREKIIDGTYPRSFLLQLKDIDNLVEQVHENRNLDRWKAFYQNSSQSVLDTMGSAQVNRTFQFLANLTVLFNLFGRQVMDQLNKK